MIATFKVKSIHYHMVCMLSNVSDACEKSKLVSDNIRCRTGRTNIKSKLDLFHVMLWYSMMQYKVHLSSRKLVFVTMVFVSPVSVKAGCQFPQYQSQFSQSNIRVLNTIVTPQTIKRCNKCDWSRCLTS